MKTLIRNAAEFVLAIYSFNSFNNHTSLIKKSLRAKIIPLIVSNKSNQEINKAVSKIKNKTLKLPEMYKFYEFLLKNNTNRIFVGYGCLEHYEAEDQDYNYQELRSFDDIIFKDVFVLFNNKYYTCGNIFSNRAFDHFNYFDSEYVRTRINYLNCYEEIFDTPAKVYSYYIERCIKIGNIELETLKNEIKGLKELIKSKKSIMELNIYDKVYETYMFENKDEDLSLFKS